ncbi:MFS transporter [Saccharothrix obliqua]|uniref:MFS transporter n=1 Tax=Saccharothrix obliqua TaxID=2861747 RepID=UPI001C603D53|nr:MFS transporter [Saccharothrix obliqua]MBW4721904.1 MFS transporter [Saccharothrix obliqua]
MPAESTIRSKGAVAGLMVLAVAQFLIALDYSIVYIALPSIGDDLALTESSLQWVVSGYAVFFAGFLVVGGRVSDRFGARRIFVGAMLVFGVASLAGGFAGGPEALLIARGAQGVAAAMLQPTIISLINTTFAAGPARTRALSVWGAVGASGLAAGVILGGLLTTASWRWVFFINLPLAIFCGLAAPKFLAKPAESRSRERTTLNVPSAVLCTGTVLAAALALTQASSVGWGHPSTLIGLGVSAVLLLAFIAQERRSSQPLVDPLLRRTRSLVVGSGSAALYMASVGNQFFLVTLLLQQLLDYGPLAAGLAFLPMAVAIAVANAVAGKVIGSLGVRLSLALAFAVDAIGLFLLAFQVHGDSYVVNILPGLLITGFSHGITYIATYDAGTRDIADRHQGVGSAMMTTSQYMAGALGIAVLVLVLGANPDSDRFAWAFATTGIAAVLGAVLVWFGLTGKRTGR